MPPYKHVVFIQKIHWKSKTFVRFSFNKNKIIFFPDLWCYFSVSDSFSAGVCQHHICWLNNERLLGVKQLSHHQGHSNRAPVYYNNNNDLKSLVVSTLSQFQHNLGLKKRKPWGGILKIVTCDRKRFVLLSLSFQSLMLVTYWNLLIMSLTPNVGFFFVACWPFDSDDVFWLNTKSTVCGRLSAVVWRLCFVSKRWII